MPRQPNNVSAIVQDHDLPANSTFMPAVMTMMPRVEAEANAIPCVIYECSQDLILKTISPTVFELIGIRPENLLLKPALWQDRLLPADQQRLLSKLNLLEVAKVASETHKIIDDRGLPVWVAHSFRKLRDNGHTVIRGCIVPLPPTEQVSSVDSVVADQFVHRIGNHFQLINLFIDSLKRKVSDVEEFEDLQRTLDRAVDFTQSFSRYSQSPVLKASVNRGELMNALIQTWAPYFSENDIAIESAFHPSVDYGSLAADPFLLDFAMGSIIRNALDAMHKGDRLIIHGRVEALGKEKVSVARIKLADTGKGMAKDEVEKAVTPFCSTKRGRDGLGLSSAIRIIELHGGVLNIKSEPGQGTEVEIVLPAEMAARYSDGQ